MRTLKLVAKCSDMCETEFKNEKGKVTKSDGYVPRNIGIGCGDYVVMDIDMETGQILNWKPVTDAQIVASQKDLR